MANRRRVFLSGLALVVGMFFVYSLRDWSLNIVMVDRTPLINGSRTPIDKDPKVPERNKGSLDLPHTTTPKFVPRKLVKGDAFLTDSKRGTIERIQRTNAINTTLRIVSRANLTHLPTTPQLPPNVAHALPSTPNVEAIKPASPYLCSPEERRDMMHRYCTQHRVAEKYLASHNIPYPANHSGSTANTSSGSTANTSSGSNTLNSSSGSAQSGSAQSGSAQSGSAQSGSAQSGSAQSGSLQPDVLDLLPDEHILRLAHELWLDPVHEVIVCMHAKAGCSTWKTILANNSGQAMVTQADVPNIHGLIFRRGMKCADDTRNVTEIRHRLRTWYKVAIVRHPYDRLVSAYNEKLAGKNTVYQKSLGAQLLKQYQPHLSAEVKAKGQGVQFQDFIQFVLDKNPRDDHFKGPYEDKCHTCLFDYDYIVKLETNARDAAFIISEKLRGRGLDTQTQINPSRSNEPDTWQRGRDLTRHFRNVTASQLQQLQKRHDSDFGLFGYAYDPPSFSAKCEGAGKNGVCC